MGNDVAVVVRRLRARREEIEQAIFARVREVAPDSAQGPDTEYVEGLRAAVAAAVEFGLAGIADGGASSSEIPREAVAQARRAARGGVSLEAVLRRYIVGHTLLWDYVMQESDRVQRAGRASGLREMSRAQAALLDRLVIGVTREHVAELRHAGGSREHHRLERVRMLLTGEPPDRHVAPGAVIPGLDYDFEAGHLGVIAGGAGVQDVLRDLARSLDCRLLCVAPGDEVAWAWLGGYDASRIADLERVLCAQVTATQSGSDLGDGPPVGASFFVVGEPGSGIEGWRLTHHQAQAALLVARRTTRPFTRYCDVALPAAALRDDTLLRSLTEIYISPLRDARGGGEVLIETLQAYLAAERNVSSTAVALSLARSTVVNRLRTIEERLGCTLHSCRPEHIDVEKLDLQQVLLTPDRFRGVPLGRDGVLRSDQSKEEVMTPHPARRTVLPAPRSTPR
jgi:hypothetical protein